MLSVKKITVFSAVLFLVLLVVNSFYAFPSADDFSYYIKQKSAGFWEFQKWHYMNWGGRYIPNAFLGFFKFTGSGLIWYQSIAASVIVSLALAFYYFSKNVLSQKNALFISAIMFLSYCFSLYSVAQAFYWMPGSITYTLGITLSLLVWSLIPKISSSYAFAVIIFSVLILNGTNEVVMLMFNSSLIMLVIYHSMQGLNMSRRIYFILAISFLMMLISLMSPGNSARTLAENSENTHNLFFALPRALYRSFTFLYEKFFIFAIATLVIINFTDVPALKTKIFEKHKLLTKIVVLLFPFCILVGGVFLSYFATGRIPPERTVNTIAFFFMMAVLLSALYWKENFGKQLQFSKKTIIFSTFLLLLTIVSVPNELKSNADDLLSGRSADFSRQMNEREDLLLNSNEQDITVKKISALPNTLFFKDITTDSNSFFNYYYAKYYHKNTVKTVE